MSVISGSVAQRCPVEYTDKENVFVLSTVFGDAYKFQVCAERNSLSLISSIFEIPSSVEVKKEEINKSG